MKKNINADRYVEIEVYAAETQALSTGGNLF